MAEALLEARKAYSEGEVPVGAVVVKDGKIIGRGHNHREAKLDISSHAEIEALKQAAAFLGTWRMDGCSLYVTLEPCLMCAGAIKQSRLSSLHIGALDPLYGAESRYGLFSSIDAYGGILAYVREREEETKAILDDFFASKREGKNK